MNMTHPPTTETTTAAPTDKWAANRHRVYMDAALKTLCDLACQDGRISLSTLLQRAARRYVRMKADGLHQRLAQLPTEEQTRLNPLLETLLKKDRRNRNKRRA